MTTRAVSDLADEYDGLEGGPLNMNHLDIKCPDCDKFYHAIEWTSHEVDCETCGGHQSLKCPSAGWHTFAAYGGTHDELEVRDHVDQP